MTAMTATAAPARYGSLAIALHWFMLLLLIGVFASVELHEAFPRESPTRAWMMRMHFSLGLAVFFLVWVRLAARVLGTPAPRIEPALPAWHSLFAAAMHFALYALMIAMPVIGWLMVNAKGRMVPFFGLELPQLIGADKGLAHTLGEIHEVGGNLFYILVALHTVAALAHHYFLRNNTLRRMLPIAGV